MSEFETLKELCQRLGASPAQAEVMARQLLKRADQVAATQGVSREQAMARLLQVVTQGRQGIVPPEAPSPPSSSK